jgi:hypothetical protein
MIHRKLLAPTACLLAGGLLLAACGGDGGDSAGDIPTASDDGSSSDASGGSAPEVSDPIATEAFTVDVCAALSAEKVGELGLTDPTPREAATGQSCNWNFTDEDTDRADITGMEPNTNGLSDIYDQADAFEYFEPTEIAGHPAVYASVSDLRGDGDCGLYIGLNDAFAVSVGVMLGSGPDRADPCPVAAAIAAAMIETLSGTAGEGSSGSDVEASTPVEQVIVDMVGSINGGDASGAMGFVCEGSESVVQTAVDELALEQPDLHVEAFIPGDAGSVTVTATGSAGGAPVTATIGATELSTGPCVVAVFVS